MLICIYMYVCEFEFIKSRIDIGISETVNNIDSSVCKYTYECVIFFTEALVISNTSDCIKLHLLSKKTIHTYICIEYNFKW